MYLWLPTPTKISRELKIQPSKLSEEAKMTILTQVLNPYTPPFNRRAAPSKTLTFSTPPLRLKTKRSWSCGGNILSEFSSFALFLFFRVMDSCFDVTCFTIVLAGSSFVYLRRNLWHWADKDNRALVSAAEGGNSGTGLQRKRLFFPFSCVLQYFYWV